MVNDVPSPVVAGKVCSCSNMSMIASGSVASPLFAFSAATTVPSRVRQGSLITAALTLMRLAKPVVLAGRKVEPLSLNSSIFCAVNSCVTVAA